MGVVSNVTLKSFRPLRWAMLPAAAIGWAAFAQTDPGQDPTGLNIPADVIVFGRYLLLAGVIRFVIEFVRVNEPVAGPFTLAQLIAGGVAVAGMTLLAVNRRAATV